MDITKYIRTDLAAESGAPTADQKERERHEGDGYLWECRPLCEGTELSSLTILNAEGAERFGRECGRYITLSFGDIWLLGDEEKSALCRQLTFQLLQLAQASAPNYRRVLVCGLGNRDLTTDAIGPLTVRSLQVNRHILPPEEPAPRVELSAFCPGVLGQTGIESADLILAAVQHVRPDLVIHRVTGDGPGDLLIAPTWSQAKRTVLNELHHRMKEEHAYQGQLLDEEKGGNNRKACFFHPVM